MLIRSCGVYLLFLEFITSIFSNRLINAFLSFHQLDLSYLCWYNLLSIADIYEVYYVYLTYAFVNDQGKADRTMEKVYHSSAYSIACN